MKLKTFLLALDEEITNIYTEIDKGIEGDFGEKIAEEITSITEILWDYTSCYSKDNIDLIDIEDLELLPEYAGKEQEIMEQLFYHIYLYAYCLSQNKDRVIHEYHYLINNLFWKAFCMINYDEIEIKERFYDTYLWLNGTNFLFGERQTLHGPYELHSLMFTAKGREVLERGSYVTFPFN